MSHPGLTDSGGGRALADDLALRPWAQRHNLLAARSGFALPDLTLYRDGGFEVLRCVPDPSRSASPYPVQFVVDGEFRLPFAEAEEGLRGFVAAVADRAREQVPADHPEAREFLANWEAIRESIRTESRLCSAAAALQLDPYDPSELTEKVVALLEGPFAALGPTLQLDLSEAATGPTLPVDLEWVQRAVTALRGAAAGAQHASPPPDAGAEQAHRVGYERARGFRKQFGLPAPVDDLEEFLRDRCGWSPELEGVPPQDGVANRIGGLVGPDDAGRPRLVTPDIAGPPLTTRRFLFGWALFFAPTADFHAPPRLLTRASSWPQRASRAFAAELLAPAKELSQRVARQEVTYEEVGELAREFRVSEMVIGHQLENHQLARIVDL